jgi:hypothetical protein
MSFLFGIGLGALLTMGVAFVVAADKNDVDENEQDWYT